MNSQKLPRGNALKNFSEVERRFVCLARRRRANYLRLLKQLKASPSMNGRRALLIGACALGLLATNAQAAVSAPELFNQANAAQRADRLGPAILGYERARLLSPTESSIEQNLHIAPAADAQSTFELKAGETVTAQREYGDFVLVRTLDQRSGWVKKGDVERVIPATNLSPM